MKNHFLPINEIARSAHILHELYEIKFYRACLPGYLHRIWSLAVERMFAPRAYEHTICAIETLNEKSKKKEVFRAIKTLDRESKEKRRLSCDKNVE